jgi:hypothetical protein
MLWFARISAIIWAYMYHDWQAIPLLIFVAHSSFYTNRNLFQEFLVYLYCPYALLYMLWMFVINIPGVYAFSEEDPPNANTINMYNYGFYKYEIPILEQPMIIAFVLFFFGLLGMFIQDKNRTTLNREMIEKILDKNTNPFY